MLVGGDYDTKGLERCGPAVAIKAAKHGLGKSLCQCQTVRDCQIWGMELARWLANQRSFHGLVPASFPDLKVLQNYNKPVVPTDGQLLNLRGLKNGWNQPIDEIKLLEVTSSRFNIWGRLYMNWVGPVLLTKSIMNEDRPTPAYDPHEIKIVKQRGKKDQEGDSPVTLERTITFSPFEFTALTRSDFEGGERQGYWTGVREDSFDRGHRVKWEFPTFIIEKLLPGGVPDSPPKAPAKNKRKSQGKNEDTELDPTPRKRPRK